MTPRLCVQGDFPDRSRQHKPKCPQAPASRVTPPPASREDGDLMNPTCPASSVFSLYSRFDSRDFTYFEFVIEITNKSSISIVFAPFGLAVEEEKKKSQAPPPSGQFPNALRWTVCTVPAQAKFETLQFVSSLTSFRARSTVPARQTREQRYTGRGKGRGGQNSSWRIALRGQRRRDMASRNWLVALSIGGTVTPDMDLTHPARGGGGEGWGAPSTDFKFFLILLLQRWNISDLAR